MPYQVLIGHEQEEKAMEFIKAFISSLKGFRTVNELKVQTAYDMISEDQEHELTGPQKTSLFGFMKKIKCIISIKDSKDNKQTNEFEFIGIDLNEETCLVKLVIGDVSDTQKLKLIADFDKDQDTKVFYIVLIDVDSVIEINRESLESNKDKEEEKKEKEVNKEQQKEYQKVLRTLKDEVLHSAGLIKAYGSIKYVELFSCLVRKERDDRDKKWNDYFIGDRSNVCTHACLVSIREYIRKYKDDFLN